MLVPTQAFWTESLESCLDFAFTLLQVIQVSTMDVLMRDSEPPKMPKLDSIELNKDEQIANSF